MIDNYFFMEFKAFGHLGIRSIIAWNMDQKRVKMHREWCKILFASGKKKFFPEKKLDIRCKLTFRKGCQKPQNIEGFSLENFSHFASPEFFFDEGTWCVCVRRIFVCCKSKTHLPFFKKNALEWLDHFDFMTFLQPKWGKKLIIKLGRILTFLQSVVSALTTDFFSYESFKKLRGGTGTKVLYDLRSCPLTLSRGFFFKIAAAKQQKKIIFSNANLFKWKTIFKIGWIIQKGFSLHFYTCLEGFVLRQWRLSKNPFDDITHESWHLSCSVQTDKLADVNQSLSDNNLSNFKKGFKLTFCSKVGLSPLSVVTHWAGFTGLEAFLKITSPTWKMEKRDLYSLLKMKLGWGMGWWHFSHHLKKMFGAHFENAITCSTSSFQIRWDCASDSVESLFALINERY